MPEDREYTGAPDYAGQQDEGDDVEGHAYKKADEGDEAYAKEEPKEEPPDVEGHYHGAAEYTD